MTSENETKQKRAEHAKSLRYETVISGFLKKGQGCFITLTEDQVFLSMLRNMLSKNLGLAPSGFIHPMQEAALLLRELGRLREDGLKPFLIMERRYNGADMGFRVGEYKQAFPDMFVLILTADLEQDTVAYLHELGADNFIAKPFSAQTIIEKLAFTIKPQGKLGEYIDEAKALLEDGLPEQARQMVDKCFEAALEQDPGMAAAAKELRELL